MQRQAYRMQRVTASLFAALVALASPAFAEDSSYVCKLSDEPMTLIFSDTAVVSKNDKGEYGKPTEVEFSYSPVGKRRVWSTTDGGKRFVLVEDQFFVMSPSGELLGKIVCE